MRVAQVPDSSPPLGLSAMAVNLLANPGALVHEDVIKWIGSFLLTCEEGRWLLASRSLFVAYPFFEDARYCYHMFLAWQSERVAEEAQIASVVLSSIDYEPDTD